VLAGLALGFGKDVNWDLQNYHDYAPWALLHGGYSRIWQQSDLAGFGNLSYNRFFLGLALAIYQTGETPEIPGEQGIPQGAENGEPHTP